MTSRRCALVLIAACLGCGDDAADGLPPDSGTDGTAPTPDAVALDAPAQDTAPPSDVGSSDVDVAPTDSAGIDAAPPPMCPMAACNVIDPVSCGGGQACHLIGVGSADPAPRCVAAGATGEGGSCVTPSDCAAGLYCDPANNLCRRYCCGDHATCLEGQRCSVEIVDVGGAPTGIRYCLPTVECDLVAQTGCPSNQACYLTDAAAGVLMCLAAPTPGAAEGQACATANTCARGHGCLGDPGRCYRFCTIGSMECGPMRNCVRIEAGERMVGVCMPLPS